MYALESVDKIDTGSCCRLIGSDIATRVVTSEAIDASVLIAKLFAQYLSHLTQTITYVACSIQNFNIIRGALLVVGRRCTLNLHRLTLYQATVHRNKMYV